MKHEKPELDDADRRLLKAVQRDASASQAELAEASGVSPSQVSRRLARLKEAGALKAIVGLVEPKTAGLSCAAFIRIRLRDHSTQSVREFRETVADMPEATMCVAITGEADYLLKTVSRDLPHFQEIVQTRLLQCRAIAHLESSIVLEYLKDTTELPL
jgi:Lrp/AsnC family transcriptional regulator, leucine-responsive regulatory protein